MPREHLLKIGVSGIRGVVGEFLTPGLAVRVRAGVRHLRGAGRVVVGRDTRSSGEMLQHAVTLRAARGGLRGGGRRRAADADHPDVRRGATRARGGIALTASHNPPEYNALKLFNAEGLFFNSYERSELLDLYHQSDFRQAANDEIRSVPHGTRDAPRACTSSAC